MFDNKTQSKFLYLDSSLPVMERVRDLLGRMTLEEKIAQTGFVMGMKLIKKSRFSLDIARGFLGDSGIGGVMDPWLAGVVTARVVNSVQKYLLKKTRLGIPALIMGECLHGHLSPGATIFPQSIGLSCSWNPKLVRQIAAAAAKEARSVGIRQAFSPNLDLARDPRWGRVEETYGEDTYLCTQMGVAYIRGLQGRGVKIGKDKLIATPKHFAGHCDPQGGINLGPARMGERELREEHLPSFKAAVEAGVLSIMPAYNEIDGVPCSISKFLLQQILREEWVFEGYVFSDFCAVEQLASWHNTAGDFQEAGRQAFEAGVDMEAPTVLCYGKKLLALVRKGVVSKERLDDAVSRILRAKFAAGLFEQPYVDEKIVLQAVHCDKHVKLARKSAAESMVLLKNENQLLPLEKNKINSIAVLGPSADMAECGDYCFPKSQDVSPLEGISNAIPRKIKVNYAPGSDLHGLSKDGFAEAVQAAIDSDVAIVFVGGSSMSLGGVGWKIDGKDTRPSTCGEGFDRADLNLPGVQQDLIEAVVATGKPVVVVLINGRPLSITWIAENVPAILEAWYPGEQGGNAIADILFGKVNPSGKLTFSIPRLVGQVPKYYSQKTSARGTYNRPGSPGQPGRDYVYSDPSPLYEFGFGLSYTTFKYSNLRVSPNKISKEGKIHVNVKVSNTGKLDGREIVQLYINDLVSSVTTPGRLLKRFEKIQLKAGQSKTVNFELGPADLSLLNADMKRTVEPGHFEIMIANLRKQFEVC